MRFCEFEKCELPVFGTDKNTRKGYCKKHQSQRTDFDSRPILLRAIQKKQKSLNNKVRGLIGTDANLETTYKVTEADLNEWFLYHMAHSQKRCENCGASLEHYSLKYWRGSHHHIIDKSEQNGCPSVAAELLNHGVLGFWCCHSQWHTNYHNAQKMKCFPVFKARFDLFKHLIADEERRKIPECFLIQVVNS